MRSALVLLKLGALLLISSTAIAAEFYQWSTSSGTSGPFYDTQDEAVEALRHQTPRNQFIGQDLGITFANASTVQYKIGTPRVDPNISDWSYINIVSGARFITESALIASMEAAWVTDPRCGSESFSGNGDWTPEFPPAPPYGARSELRQYTVTYGYWVEDPENPHCQTTTSSASAARQRDITCPVYYSLASTAPYCRDSNFSYVYRQVLACDCDSNGANTNVGNPISVASGQKLQTDVDYRGAGLELVRTYRSWGTDTYARLRTGWTHNYAARLVMSDSAPRAAIRPDGSLDIVQAVNSKYVSLSGSNIHFLLEGGFWSAYLPDGSKEVYDGAGNLMSLVSASGLTTAVVWDAVNKKLLYVQGPFGHQIQFLYVGEGLSQVILPDGSSIYYGAAVYYPDGTSRSYLYEDPAHPSALTGIVDQDGIQFATFTYDSKGRATSSQHAGGVYSYSVSYGTNSAVVTDPLLGVQTFNFTASNDAGRRVSSHTRGGLTTQFTVPAYATDNQRRVTQSTDPRGYISKWTYDRDHVLTYTEAFGTAVQRASSYTYRSIYTSQPLVTTTPRNKTTYVYDANKRVQSRTVTDTTVTPNVSRVWTYTYNNYGQMLTEDGPRTDVSDITSYTYYNCTNGWQPSGWHCGQIQSIADPLGHATTYDFYNAHGQPTQVTDPNGVVSTFAYDARQRLTAKCVGATLPTCSGGELTSMTYRPTGLLQSVTLPDSSIITYGYDAAHRLVQVQDGAGNTISYTLDAMGNRTDENVFDPANALRRTHSRAFNTLNQLYREINAAATGGAYTEFSYDNSGNQTGVAAPLGRTTTNLYDQLNRIKQITDPAAGNTYLAYDSQDNLTTVTDPRGKVTSYTYSGFGDLKTQTSPDTGVTTNTYDSAGNLSTSTDARGAVAAYAYDVKNRVTSVSFTKSGATDQTIAFSYDSGTHGKGRLTGAADANHSMSWVYDPQGRVTDKTQTVGGVGQSVSYGYTNGLMTSLTLPSGNVVTYGYNGNGQVSSVVVGSTNVLGSIAYEPFGPVKGWTWGNGVTQSRAYDQDGRLTSIASSHSNGVNLAYAYDAASRITGQTGAGSNPNSWTYGYDLLDRLTSAIGPSQTQGWTYDGNGNRLSETGTQASTFTVSSTSNRLASTTGFINRTYAYDPAGNALSYEDVTLAYNNRGRLLSTTKNLSTRDYVYNALGQLVKAIGGAGGTTHYAYDEAGHLLGEYDASGALIQETVWLGDIPVATLRPGSPVQIHYIHADHLNTPVRITQASDNARRWQWNRDPFGTLAAMEDPESLGAFVYNLRFPGQMFDGQAGLHQNWHRDYSPATGRYVRGDPLGLMGGLNPYVYASSTPNTLADPLGLFALDWSESWRDVDLPGGRKGVGGYTEGRIENARCTCTGSGGCWSLSACSALLHVKVQILASAWGDEDRFLRKSEGQHATDFARGFGKIYEAGRRAEQSALGKMFSTKEACETSSSAIVSSALWGAANSVAMASAATYDPGRHTWRWFYRFF